ncbi:hypothetical protein V6N12_002234 [Hibiscus sabdariffa]|uniref:Uncharacterized protein n=1 Tax=Hibiscus sabdariffa TaxID=183260 RepID=A0ABR1ZM54_9ROSI
MAPATGDTTATGDDLLPQIVSDDSSEQAFSNKREVDAFLSPSLCVVTPCMSTTGRDTTVGANHAPNCDVEAALHVPNCNAEVEPPVAPYVSPEATTPIQSTATPMHDVASDGAMVSSPVISMEHPIDDSQEPIVDSTHDSLLVSGGTTAPDLLDHLSAADAVDTAILPVEEGLSSTNTHPMVTRSKAESVRKRGAPLISIQGRAGKAATTGGFPIIRPTALMLLPLEAPTTCQP